MQSNLLFLNDFPSFFIVVFDLDFWMKELNCRELKVKLNRVTLADAERLFGKNNAFEKNNRLVNITNIL